MRARFYFRKKLEIWIETRTRSLVKEVGPFLQECLLLITLIWFGKWLCGSIFMKISVILLLGVTLKDLMFFQKKCTKNTESTLSNT